jgi:hypothetical protein
MTMLFRSHFEKFLLGIATVAWLLGVGWSWERRRAIFSSPAVVSWNREEYRPAVQPPVPPPAVWETPVAQAAGGNWIFELFAPPPIFYDPETGVFRAGLSREDAAGGRGSESEMRLLAVRAVPFRVQLQGSFGPPGSRRVVLAATNSREVWCARPGERWAALGVVLTKLEIGSATSKAEESGATPTTSPQATIWDERASRTLTLRAGEPALTDELQATLQSTRSDRVRRVQEGDTWTDTGFTYRVERLNRDPAWAEISRTPSAGGMGETFRIVADDAGSRRAAAAARPTERPATLPSTRNGP